MFNRAYESLLVLQRLRWIHPGGLEIVIQHHGGAQQTHDHQRQQEHRRHKAHPVRKLLQVIPHHQPAAGRHNAIVKESGNIVCKR